MVPHLVVADDMTGAHASAQALRGPAGRVAVVVSTATTPEHRRLIAGLADAIVCCTGTRHATPAQAADAVRAALHQWWPVVRVSKRVDSTLRGPVGAELSALVRELATLSGHRVLALVCAAHPAAGRSTRYGRQHLHGVRIDLSTERAAGAEPLDESRILPRLEDGTLRGGEVFIDVVRSGVPACVAEVSRALTDGLDFLVFDAETLDDVDRVATCAAQVTAQRPEVAVVTVDPGPLTARLAMLSDPAPTRSAAPALAVVGSVSDLTRRQVARLTARHPTRVVPVLEVSARGTAGLRPVDDVVHDLVLLSESAPPDAVLLLTSLIARDGHDHHVGPEVSREVPRTLGLAVRRFLDVRPVSGLFLTGGEVAAGVLDALGAVGIRPLAEVEPLAVTGCVVGGPWSGLRVVTKGGLVGTEETLVRCVEKLCHGHNGGLSTKGN